MDEKDFVVSESHVGCEGPVVLALCTRTNILYCVCEECDLTWDHPDKVSTVDANGQRLRCPNACYTFAPEALLRSSGWDRFVLRRGNNPL